MTTEPWKTNIKFTVTPTDDPDVVDVRQEGNVWPVQRNRVDGGGDNPGPATIAARAYFEAHPPKPAHPLAGARVGEWWLLGYRSGLTEVMQIKVHTLESVGTGLVSARQVYVLPKAEADAVVALRARLMYDTAATPLNALLELAL